MLQPKRNRSYRITIYTILILLFVAGVFLARTLTQNTSDTQTAAPDTAPEHDPLSESHTAFSSQPADTAADETGHTAEDAVNHETDTGSEAGEENASANKATAGTNEEADPPRTVDPALPMVALTFDDGPGRGTTAILDLLEQYDARATFFVLGLCLEQPAQVEKMQRAYDLGCTIGSHTYDHISFKKLNASEIRDQIDRTNEILTETIGTPAALIRPPYGHVTDEAREAADAPFIHWSIDTEDWKSRDAQSIIEEVQDKVQDGDIILMHDIYPSTAEACETLIPWLIEQGYQLVTVPELMDAKGITMENGKSYNSAK